MQQASCGSATEQRREESENPRQVNTKPGEQREKKEDPDHPVEKARVDGMAQQFARIDNGAPQTVDGVRAVYKAIGRGRHLVLLPRGLRWRVDQLHRRRGLRAA